MKKNFVLILLFLIGNILFAQSKYLKLKVETNNKGIQLFIEQGIYAIHGFLKKDGTFIGEFDEVNFKKIQQAGIPYEIIINDLQEYYSTNKLHKSQPVHNCFQRIKQYPIPQGFQLGTMGGYYTLNQALAEIDTMRALYPQIISNKNQIGTSFQGRPIYVLKISDNPNINENEPEVLYTAIHHSQEPASLQQLIYFMYFLLENYGSNPEVTYLVNNTELYFIPIINPDGYVYNQNQNPNGGGMHRKNRRTTFFSDGVDLNRNYNWYFGYDELGSSSIGFHPWHRGDSAFSEYETRTMKNFLENQSIKIALNWHAYGNMIIYPWNYRNYYTNDSLLYEKLAQQMSYQNNYRYGTVYETYGYQSNGDADDWNYGDTNSKNRIISLTGEIGSMDDGFWPGTQRILTLCNEAIWTNIVAAHFAHAYYIFEDATSSLINQSTTYLKYKFHSIGLDTPANFTLTFVPLTNNVSFPNPVKIYSNMGLLQTKSDSILIQITATAGQEIKFLVNVNNGTYTFVDTIKKVFGNVIELFYDNCETMNHWTGDDWNITSESSYLGNFSISESPYENYWLFQTSEIVLNYPINLTGYNHAAIQFYTRHNLENNYDYVQILISTNNGQSWQPLCGSLSKVGTDDEDEGQPVYHGMLPEWTMEEISLKDFINQTIRIKFKFVSDQSITREGFYFDEFRIKALSSPSAIFFTSSKDEYCLAYPNLTRNLVTFSSNIENIDLEIYNTLGIKIFSTSENTSNFNIDVSQWQRGIYYYRVLSNPHIKGKFILY